MIVANEARLRFGHVSANNEAITALRYGKVGGKKDKKFSIQEGVRKLCP